MDVNGTRLHLVLGLEDWRAVLADPVDPDACYDLERNTFGLRPAPFVFPTREGADRLAPADRRGAAVDRHGNWFWISDDRTEIVLRGAAASDIATYWPGEADTAARAAGDFTACVIDVGAPLHLSGLTITDDHYLVVGVLDWPDPTTGDSAAALLVFDLAGQGPPVPMWWPAALGVRPFDLAALPGGGLVVLDVADPDVPGASRLWQLDRHLRLVNLGGPSEMTPAPSPWAPKEATEPESVSGLMPTGLSAATVGHARELGASWAVSVAALADRTVLVLDRSGPTGRPELSRWDCGRPVAFGIRVGADAAADDPLLCVDQGSNAHEVLDGLMGHDLTVVFDGSPLGTLYLVGAGGDQAFAFRLDEAGAELEVDYHPLRLFGGKGLVACGDLAFYDLDDRWFAVPTKPVERFANDAIASLAPPSDGGRGFDGLTPGTVWHRLLLDATIPPGTSVTVETRAADDVVVLEGCPWLPEPRPYRRGGGSEVPYHRYGDGDSTSKGTWELLLQRAVGRFLQIRLTLRGDGRHTPRIWAARLHFPRFSYLEQYLPAVYREDRESASFLDRYLSNVEGLYTTFEGRIVDYQRMVDPDTTESEYLAWLASWVGATVEPDWEPERVRLFVKHASRLFARRGTNRGLIESIRLATHPCPTEEIFDAGAAGDGFDVRIVEGFRTRATAGVVYGDPTDLSGPRLATTGAQRWALDDGRDAFVQRWREFLGRRYRAAGAALIAAVSANWEVATDLRFPPLTPSQTMAAADWGDFVRGELESPYAEVGTDDDLALWRAFLASRYRRLADYRSAWNLQNGASSFSTIMFPTELPADGAPLHDWITFVSSTLPIHRSAHRFSVLVPIRIEDSPSERDDRIGRVQHIVDTDRPAHTSVDVKPYWAALRVGEARVGYETIVGEGGRYIDITLGTGRLAYVALPGGTTWRLDDRYVVGRDRIEQAEHETAGTGGRT